MLQWVISEQDPEVISNAKKVKRVVFSAGKVYYDLLKTRTDKRTKDIALIRVEQLAPFPFQLVRDEARKYPNAEVVWCQEEPLNQGYYFYILPRFITSLKADRGLQGATPTYIGRQPSASTATGHHHVHDHELLQFLTQVFNV